MTSLRLVTSWHWAIDYMTPTGVTEDLNKHYHTDKNRAGTINKVAASLVSAKVTLSAQMDQTFVQCHIGLKLNFVCYLGKGCYCGLVFRWHIQLWMVREVWKSTFSERDLRVQASFGMQQSSWVQMTDTEKNSWRVLMRSASVYMQRKEGAREPIRKQNAHSSAAASLSCYRNRNNESRGQTQKLECMMVSSQAHAVRVNQKQLEHIYTRVSRVYIYSEGRRFESAILCCGHRPEQPIPTPISQHSPSKGKEAKMTKKEFTRDKTNKQEGTVKHLVKCLSVFPKSLFVKKKSCKSELKNCLFSFLFFEFLSFCFCMDTGKRSSISPTFGKCVFV